ncbi:CD2 antigen cytoplasmic tail-binding protein 2 homolog [Planococcus citri]|uniref:CD2 antigen cytoplasmic tail-binding protein 2 homolog n=1 Tax=Planococcus citri TaxID=170843 RepID=UPI0031F8A90C
MNKRKADDNEDDILDMKFSKRKGVIEEEDDDDDDENDDGKKYEILKEDDIEGQEAGVVTNEGDVQITPFNMKEEMEEGHFDTEGMYHWNKESNVRDNWLENIDWIKIKSNEENLPKKQESDDDEETSFDEIGNYKQVLLYMRERENVAATLRRLGGSKSLSASERLKRKKAGIALTEEEKGDKEAVTKVTELADAILSRTGNMNIYQETYEQISKKINDQEKKMSKKSFAADLDMYADDFDEKEKAELTTASTSKASSDTAVEESEGNDVKWEIKKSLDAEAIEGPYSTEQMNKWMQENYFKEQVWVRKFGSSNEFYSSKRIDFELYL